MLDVIHTPDITDLTHQMQYIFSWNQVCEKKKIGKSLQENVQG